VDNRDPIQPRFDNRNVQGKIGLDSKFVFHDSLVLDTTINPDFAQIESDQPQNTVNQRFEVFFPEKRPFFLENSNFFSDTNIGVYSLSRLLFTRRIIQPSFGARFTGNHPQQRELSVHSRAFTPRHRAIQRPAGESNLQLPAHHPKPEL